MANFTLAKFELFPPYLLVHLSFPQVPTYENGGGMENKFVSFSAIFAEPPTHNNCLERCVFMPYAKVIGVVAPNISRKVLRIEDMFNGVRTWIVAAIAI